MHYIAGERVRRSGDQASNTWSIAYMYYYEKTHQKVAARNNILRKLTNSKWGAKPTVLRTDP